MTLHIFNPEHDIALAANLSNFTAPHAGRQLRHDLGFLPMLWAGEGDAVLVDDVKAVPAAWKRRSRARLVDKRELRQLPLHGVEPWGWDLALRVFLLRHGVDEGLLPSTDDIGQIRQLSHRRVAAALLPRLRMEGTVGEASECEGAEEVAERVRRYETAVLKAPWSSSGRGLRFVKDTEQVEGWLRNQLKAQGSVMVEPYYNKVKDFGMEFVSDGKGGVSYLGLSLFSTANGAYTGNVLATEETKQQMMSRYASEALLTQVQQRICERLGEEFCGRYCGPFGVDMMVVAHADGEGFLLHPCVEINLRRTMGHVALSLSPTDDDVRRVMRIVYTNENYKLIFRRL